jgi:hypothetical protein
MQFNRSALIAAIDKAISQEQRAVDAIAARNEKHNEDHRREWLSLHEEGWMRATAKIRAKLRKGEPVTEADIPLDRSGMRRMAFYQPKRGEPTPVRAAELAGLRAVLLAVSDDTISSASLRILGVGASTLRLVVPLLGEASVRSGDTKVTD